MQVKHELKYCGHCNAQFECKQADVINCQCHKVNISEATVNFLMGASYDCLCANCLLKFENEISNKTNPNTNAYD